MNSQHLSPLLIILCLTPALIAEDNPDVIAARKLKHVPKMSYLDNGTIKIGVDLNLGGAITYLSLADREANVVNNWDWGRQIQMSHYSGPTPFEVPGKQPARAWAKFGWNPVQAGDHFGHASKVVESSNDEKELFIKCVPMQWSFADVPSECRYETRITLKGNTAKVRCKLIASRQDNTLYPAQAQECPAIYVNSDYYRLMTYNGEEPFTGKATSRISKRVKKGDDFPWARFHATEHWAAQVNDDGFGLGVYQPGCVKFLGGFSGKPRQGGTKEPSTGYIAPLRHEMLDHNIEFAYEYMLILGQLNDIRKQAYELHGDAKLPAFSFTKNRQGWTFANARDQGWPVKDFWHLTAREPGAQLFSPTTFWQAKDAPLLKIEAAFKGKGDHVRVFWLRQLRGEFRAEESSVFAIKGDGEMRQYQFKLGESPMYEGGNLQLRIDTGLCEEVRITSIILGK